METSVRLKALDKEAAVLVLNHSLRFPGDTHIFDRLFAHAAEQAQRLLSRHQHLAAHQFPVYFYGHPYFKILPCDFQAGPKFRAGYIQFHCASAKKERQRAGSGNRAPVYLIMGDFT